MIKNIIFDLGGVLVDFDPKSSMNNHIDKKYHSLFFENVYHSQEWYDLDKGLITVEQAYEKMSSRLPECLYESLNTILYDHEGEMPPIAEMYSVVKHLKNSGFNLYLLSNCPVWFDTYKNSVPACKFFDGFVISAQYNQNKPEKEIYYTLLNEFNLKAEECFFIDDSKANTDAAEEIGIKSYCFADGDIDKLMNIFKELT